MAGFAVRKKVQAQGDQDWLPTLEEPPQPVGRLLTLAEACERLGGISRNTFYAQVRHAPGFPVLRIGRILRVPELPLEAWLARQVHRQTERTWVAR